MTELSYGDREKQAKQTALSAELRFQWECKTLGIDPDSITGSPLLVIAARRAEVHGRQQLREKLRELPGFRF